MEFTIYDKTNISTINERNNNIEYLKNLVQNDINTYIDNCSAKMLLIGFDNIYMPMVICESHKKQTYLTSLISSYIDYPMHILNNCLINVAFGIFHKILELGNIDKVIYVNHWLISTNIYYDLSDNQIQELTKFLKQNFPDYAICFKNISQKNNYNVFHALKNNNYKFLINRCSYFINDFDKVYKMRNIRKDLSLSKRSNYHISNKYVSSDKYEQLYKQLYINKYTNLNPHYNNIYFNMMKSSGLKIPNLLNEDGNIVGFYLPFIINNTVCAPCLGYDTSITKKDGLYRLLMLDIIDFACKHNLNLNLSSGVGEFKGKRGAEPYWEYLALDYSHLNVFRRLLYYLFILITNKISFPIAKFFNIKFF